MRAAGGVMVYYRSILLLHTHAPNQKCFGQAYKPGSVFGNHLSRPAIADRLKRPTFREAAGNRLWPLLGLAPGGVYTAGMSPCRR